MITFKNIKGWGVSGEGVLSQIEKVDHIVEHWGCDLSEVEDSRSGSLSSLSDQLGEWVGVGSGVSSDEDKSLTVNIESLNLLELGDNTVNGTLEVLILDEAVNEVLELLSEHSSIEIGLLQSVILDWVMGSSNHNTKSLVILNLGNQSLEETNSQTNMLKVVSMRSESSSSVSNSKTLVGWNVLIYVLSVQFLIQINNFLG